jgi:hypothetical protein
MNGINDIQGVWKVIAYQHDGVDWTPEDLSRRAHMILVSEPVVPGSQGLWGEVKFLHTPTTSILAQSIAALRNLVEGSQFDQSLEWYIYSGGFVRLRNEDDSTGAIDFVVYHGPYCTAPGPELSITRGIFRYNGTHLTVCFADADEADRPSAFSTARTRRQSISVYARETASAD